MTAEANPGSLDETPAETLIEAVIVNHQTSLYSTLALRSLAACRTPGVNLAITVADNHSTDPDIDELRTAAHQVGAEFATTRWPADRASVNTHGDVLRDFVLTHPAADCFLFVDCDIDVEDSSVVRLMLEDLASDSARWAVQARFDSQEEREGPGSSLDIWAGRTVEVPIATGGAGSATTLAARVRPRCHPGFALVRNIPPVRLVAERLGFGVAVLHSADPTVAGLFDTLGLASEALALQGFRHDLSRATVHHFFNVSYQSDASKLADCRHRLGRFTPGRPA